MAKTTTRTYDYRRKASGITGLMMLFFVLLLTLFTDLEAGHDCSGEDCPVCAALQQCEDIRRELGKGCGGQSISVCRVFFLSVPVMCQFPILAFSSPVGRKVRLNN